LLELKPSPQGLSLEPKRSAFQVAFARQLPKSLRYLRDNWTLFMLGLPAILLILAFSYFPMFGGVIAFQDYSPKTGFLSPFVGLRNFRLLWESPVVLRLVRNTLGLNVMFIMCSTFFAVLMALLLNEVRTTWFKRIAQSVMFLPFFMGWTLVSLVLYGLIDYQVGTVNSMLVMFGMERVMVTDKPELWPWILTIIRIWKGTGAGCIIYLAALTGIDQQLYEAASIDGAGRWARMRHISLPGILPVIIILLLMSIGGIFYGDYGMLYAIIGNKASLYPTTDVIDTYVIRALRNNANFGMSTAVGLVQSVLGFICVFGANWMVKKYSERQRENLSLF
jgi:putative aldouronate transport system permease protein